MRARQVISESYCEWMTIYRDRKWGEKSQNKKSEMTNVQKQHGTICKTECNDEWSREKIRQTTSKNTKTCLKMMKAPVFKRPKTPLLYKVPQKATLWSQAPVPVFKFEYFYTITSPTTHKSICKVCIKILRSTVWRILTLIRELKHSNFNTRHQRLTSKGGPFNGTHCRLSCCFL